MGWFGLGYRKWTHDHVWYNNVICFQLSCRMTESINILIYSNTTMSDRMVVKWLQQVVLESLYNNTEVTQRKNSKALSDALALKLSNAVEALLSSVSATTVRPIIT